MVGEGIADDSDTGQDPDDGREGTLAATLDAILDQLRLLLDPTGCAFLIVEGDPARIRPAAAWFSSPEVAGAMGPILQRPYDPQRPGLTEAALAGGVTLVVPEMAKWRGAAAMRERLREGLDAASAEIAWDWYRRSRLMACPVRTTTGRTLGVLAIALASERQIDERELRAVDALAGMAGLAVERSELLDREAARAREEAMLSEAAREMPASLEIADVQSAILEHARRLSGAAEVVLWALEPGTDVLRVAAADGPGAPATGSMASDGDGPAGRALRSGRSGVEGTTVHVPIGLGPRSFGVLSATCATERLAAGDAVRRLEALAPLAAGAIANALDFGRERRVARALARGFVPMSRPRVAGLEVGVVYDPADLTGGGGDFFGVWPLADGAMAIVVGDVSGKGLEVSATSAMARFFVEARMWDCAAPGRALAEVNALLCARGRHVGFATAFLGVLDGDRLRFANAGHVPPLIRRADGRIDELAPSGIPLGVEAEAVWTDEETRLASGDLLFALTDGLVEARRDGKLFGEGRVRELVAREGADAGAQELVDRVHREALAWTDRIRDDIVVLAVRRR